MEDTPETLSDAQTRVDAGKYNRGGISCPCCGQLCKVYRRKLNSAMARFLIWLARYTMDRGYDPKVGGPWVEMDKFPRIQRRPGGGDFAKLRYWGLIEEMDNNDSAKRSSGIWRITPDGMMFVRGHGRVKEAALIYNNACIGFSVEEVTIRGALGTKFNYESLWKRAAV